MIRLLVLLSILETAQIALTAILFIRLVGKTTEQRNDEAVERAMRSQAARDTDDADHAARRDAMDEGFENIMSYSVNGKTGFERPDTFEK